MWLLIDDKRTPEQITTQPEKITLVARNYDEAVEAIESHRWEKIFLDHDLGDPNDAKTGYGIVKFLEEYPKHVPDCIVLVTMNPSGRENMIRGIRAIENRLGRKILSPN